MRKHAATVALSLSIAGILIANGPGEPPASRLASEGVYTAAQAQRGRALYQVNCASCHGGAMSGMDMNPPLTGGRFLSSWNGQTAGALAIRVRTTMPIDQPGKLSLAQTADLVAYLFQENDLRPGQAELPPSVRELELIKIDAGRDSG